MPSSLYTIASLLAIFAACDAFVTPGSNGAVSTKLHLLPTQGSQLVAAFNAECGKHMNDDNDDEPSVVNMTKEPSEAVANPQSPRSFVSRVFAIPSDLIQRHPRPSLEGLNDRDDPSHDDILYYPVVGFQYVSVIGDNGEQLSRAIPTEKSNSSCRIPKKSEHLFGWYSPGCRISD